MPQDIRNYFISSKLNSEKKNTTDNKPHRKAVVLSSDEDEVKEASSSKNKMIKTPSHLKSKLNSRKSSKKRTIVSSDEDEVEIKNKTKTYNGSKSSNHTEKTLEVIENIEEVFNKKPVKRINASKITKKTKQEQEMKSSKNLSVMSEDDNIDATLNQLDTSKIEDEYLSAISNETSHKLKDKNVDSKKKQNISNKKHQREEINISDSEKKKIDSSESRNKEEDTYKKTSRSNKSMEKDQQDIKHEKLKKKEDYFQEKPKTGTDKMNKDSNEAKETNYNDIIQEKIEKKKQHAILYQNYLNRGGARNPGSKEIPQGAEQCLANLSFLITGVLDSLERGEVEEIIKQYGGKILHSVSKKLSYIIIGDEPGPSKMAKAESLGVKKLSEDEFLNLLQTSPPGVNSKKLNIADGSNKRKRANSVSLDDQKSPRKTKRNKEDSPSNNILKSSLENETSSIKIGTKTKISSPQKTKTSKDDMDEIKLSKIETKESNSDESLISNKTNKLAPGVDNLTALVEKYRPKEIKHLIGQTGDKSNANKLVLWLSNWHKNHGKNSKATKPKFSSRDDSGIIYKAALLSGPPGIGKTTTAYVVCNQLGFEVLEFNASDTRSKKLLQEEIAGILSNKTVKSFLIKSEEKKTAKHVLLMDEVDGMAGNEDRGGMQELISFIKATEVPIICICNDRNSQKIKSLANYTFDLRFQKPRLEQIRGAMMSLCFKEGIKITPDQLTQIIQSTNQDIRQVINHVAVLSAKSQTVEEMNEKTKYKNLKLGPWDVARKVFSAEEHKHMNIHDKSDLFFHDYSIAPLFVEENYLIITPSGSKSNYFDKVANCSESLAIGDTIENAIRGGQSWNLLPVQACFSSVIPGTIMSGFINSQINFPSWLGKNSKKSKCDRFLQDITIHSRITTGASKEAINLDYAKMLVDSIMRPLIVEGLEGVDKAVNVMNSYHLSREDLDSIIELTKWPHTRDPMQSLDSKIKTAFTKAYNKSASFFSAGTMKKKSTKDIDEDFVDNSEEKVESDNNEEDENIENDKLIKAKTSKIKNAQSENKNKTKKNSIRGKKKLI